MVATMLSTLQFCKKVAQDGTPIEPRVQFTNGGTWSVNPRSPMIPVPYVPPQSLECNVQSGPLSLFPCKAVNMKQLAC